VDKSDDRKDVSGRMLYTIPRSYRCEIIVMNVHETTEDNSCYK